MKRKLAIANIVMTLAFSTGAGATQMQMPGDSPGVSKPEGSSTSTKTLTGTVSDAMCGAHHMEKGKTAAECTRDCVKQGTKYALVVGEKIYTLEGHEPELDKVAGMKATIKGRVSGETLTVQSVVPAMKMK